MPIGVIINCCAVLFGGVLGALIGGKMPERLKQALPVVFGFSAMTNGLIMALQVKNLPPVIFSLIFGTIVGELLLLNDGVVLGARRLNKLMQRGKDISEENLEFFTSMLVLFCASGLGIFGVLNEGLAGDHSILILKSILDFFTAMIFASSAGILIAAIAMPQLCIFLLLFLLAKIIMPLTNPEMLADFSACGGIITVACGFQILRLKQIKVVNMLPGLLFAMPLSYLWVLLIK